MKLLLVVYITSLSIINVFSQTLKKAEVVSLNGTEVYYEVYGKGEPLFLLHGYFGSSKSWLPYISDFADNFEVYLIDLKGHGKSSRFTSKFTLKAAAEDLNALIRHLKLTNINAIGMSYGGDVLFQLALLQPGIIKSMISIGACGSWDVRSYPDLLQQFSPKNIHNLNWMNEYHKDELQIKSILEQFPNYIVSLSEEQMKSIKTKTMVILGDQDDLIPLDCIASLRDNLPNFYLWILPNTGHAAHEGKNKKTFVKTSEEFFGEQ